MSKREHRSGIYSIGQIGTNRLYIGSSADISNRWYIHRRELRLGRHHSPFLQNAWSKYGPDAFEFCILEECHPVELLQFEQEYIDFLNPIFNVCPIAGSRRGAKATERGLANIRAAHAKLAALRTHCPHDHEYTKENTYFGRKDERICRTCNAERVSKIYASETTEQRESRRERAKKQAQREHEVEARRQYALSHKEEKRLYDQSRAELKAERDKARRALITDEERAIKNEYKRTYYYANKDKILDQQHKLYRDSHPEPVPATACKKGHLYTNTNFRIWQGKKLCKICRASSKRAYLDRQKQSVG